MPSPRPPKTKSTRREPPLPRRVAILPSPTASRQPHANVPPDPLALAIDTLTIRRLVGSTGISEPAIRSVLRGSPARLVTRMALARGFRELGLDVPEMLSDADPGHSNGRVAQPATSPVGSHSEPLGVVRARAIAKAPPPVAFPVDVETRAVIPRIPATFEALSERGVLRQAELMYEQPPGVVAEKARDFCAENPELSAAEFLGWFKGEFDSGRLAGAGKWSASDSFTEQASK